MVKDKTNILHKRKLLSENHKQKIGEKIKITNNKVEVIQKILDGRYKTFKKEKFVLLKMKSKKLKIEDLIKKDRCFFCGLDYNLTIHHKDLNNKNNNFSNLITLCWDCHSSIHSFIDLIRTKQEHIKVKRKGCITDRALLISGGLDSLIAYFYYIKEEYKHPFNLYFVLNHRYQSKEIKSLHKLNNIIRDFKVGFCDSLDLKQYEIGKNAFIPYRNLLISTITSGIFEKISIIGIKGDKVCDKSPEAFQEMSKCLNLLKNTSKNIIIESPFWDKTKVNLIKWILDNRNWIEKYYLKTGYKVEDLLKTSVSCYDATTLGQCGKCNSCLRKAIALEANNIDFDGWFENDIKTYPEIGKYIEKMKKGEYDKERTRESLEVFKRWGWNC